MKAQPKQTHSFRYVVIDDLPVLQRQAFLGWLVGQTCPLVDLELPKSCAYYWDYEKWYDAWIRGEEAENLD